MRVKNGSLAFARAHREGSATVLLMHNATVLLRYRATVLLRYSVAVLLRY
jgi:hypothetical protein